ncbi:AraC family transcriptional regulator [Idiomarina xiamenensis]|uniref:AraC family transcriptional regulator n=1 Tax=Idiomarina xiamenensis 10-D-4 TaxID=740709 RepID=K2KGF7_9GAMM|nr:AraC family transcriptional regulator [Idiomarina xiamenensis]EKE87073.1 AraC family transcriptional regulator [Idiomarina xiamenensis 10-D-4]
MSTIQLGASAKPSLTPTDLSTRMDRLVHRLLPLLVEDGMTETAIDDISLMRRDQPSAPQAIVYRPAVCFMLQGAKELQVGSSSVTYARLNYLLIPVMIPVSGRVSLASPAQPYVGLSFNFDIAELHELMLLLGDRIPAAKTNHSGLSVGTMDADMMQLLERLVELLEKPDDAAVLLPLIKREMMYRLLLGELGGQLRDFHLIDSQAGRIAQVIEMLKQRFHEPLRVRDLADAVHLSESALYQAFKSVTAMSPIQFQKKLRLDEARRIMLFEGMDVSSACYQVGYESPSQFSREYSRLFGRSPKADIDYFRQLPDTTLNQMVS